MADASPVIFDLPDHKPDVRLKVFDLEFHAHSIPLKLHSTFFRKFLDSPDKEGHVSKTLFKYEWETRIDKDGTWALIASVASNRPAEAHKYTGNVKREQRAFTGLLEAIYNRPYEFHATQELITLTALADYYCALPILSRTLDGAMLRSGCFVKWEICDHAALLFPIAAKLRNSLLFRECLTWLCSYWKDPVFEHVEEPKLREIAERAYNEIGCEVAKVQHVILTAIAKDLPQSAFREKLLTAGRNSLALGDAGIDLPYYMRQMVRPEMAPSQYLCDEHYELMENEFVMNRCNLIAGEELMEGRFYCATISDEDLPWDKTQNGW